MEHPYFSQFIQEQIRTIENWPKPGVMFKDITPVLQNPASFRRLVDCFMHRYGHQEIDAIACIDARGFIIGGALAYQMNTSLVPIRKKGKLPFETLSESYELEYGSAEVEIHIDAIKPKHKVLLMDDLIATGGTMAASASLIRRLEGEIIEACAIIDLPDLGGSKRLESMGIKTHAICQF